MFIIYWHLLYCFSWVNLDPEPAPLIAGLTLKNVVISGLLGTRRLLGALVAPGGYAAGGEWSLACLEWCLVGEAIPGIRDVGVGDAVDVIEDVG